MNRLARAVTTWTRACDRRLARLISYMHHTNDHRQYCHVGNTAQHCRSGLFQDLDFAGDFEDSKTTSGEILCVLGSRTVVPTSWMCKKHTSVSHSSTESEICSLDAGFRMNGPFALDFWDVVTEMLHSSKNTNTPTQQAAGNCLREEVRSTNSNTKLRRSGNRNVDERSNADHVVTNASSSQCEARCIFSKIMKR